MSFANRLLALLLLTAVAASSAPIYSNGAPNTDSGNEATEFLQAEDFTLATNTILLGARVWAFYWNDPLAGFLGSVDWAIHSNGNLQPGGALFSGTATPTASAGAPSCCANPITVMLEFALPDIHLAAGTYWLVLHNGPVGSETTDQEFFWQTANANSTARGMERPATGGAWATTGLEHAFQLDGTVAVNASAEGIPEPGTFLLSGLALAGLAYLRRR